MTIFTDTRRPTGWVDMTNEAYHADKSAISSTPLKDYRKCAATFLRKWNGIQKPIDSSALNFGSVFHAAILEPERYLSQFAVMPKFEGHHATTAHKQAKAAWLSEHTGKMILTADEYDDHRFMIDAVVENPYASALLKKGFAERSGFYVDEETGIPCKFRLDFFSEDFGSIVDIKTTKDASPHAFAQAIGKYGYHFSAAMYSEGFRAVEKVWPASFSFIAIEKSDRYRCVVYELYADELNAGLKSYHAALRRLKRSIDTGEFPRYTLPPSPIKRPDWQILEDSQYDY